MANDEHIALLKKGVDAWNKWRDKNPNSSSASPSRGRTFGSAKLGNPDRPLVNLIGPPAAEGKYPATDLSRNLTMAFLIRAHLDEKNLGGAYLSGAKLRRLEGRTSSGRTSRRRTSAGRTSWGRTSAGRTSAGRTSSGRTSWR